MAAIIVCSDFGAQENKVCHCFHFSPFYLPWSDGTRCHDLSFLNGEFQANFFHSSFSPSSRGSLVPLHFLPLEWYHLPVDKMCNTNYTGQILQKVVHASQLCSNHLCELERSFDVSCYQCSFYNWAVLEKLTFFW